MLESSMKPRDSDWFLMLGTLACLIWSSSSAASGSSPNIVLLLADDLGYSDLGSYGSEISTPNLDALAASGLRFSNFHVAASCAPTRAMLLTGVNSHTAGVANIPEAVPLEQADAAAYQGALSAEVGTIAEFLRAKGYSTYMSGKWHLGHGPGQLPSERGFHRAVSLADTGADNWRQRPYLPIYRRANWYENGSRINLPNDFYSSEYFVDKAIEYIGSEPRDKPFFAYVAFQAVHIPVQAPGEYRDRYLGVYDKGWEQLRADRTQGLIDKGMLPEGTQGYPLPTTPPWSEISPEAKAFEARGMAVYAGMVESMDHHVGRLIDHLDGLGELENTVFIFLSDNGAEGSLATRALVGEPRPATRLYRAWVKQSGFNMNFETLGEIDSYHDIGPAWASAVVGPLAWYKFFAGEGGLRVPMIIAGYRGGAPVVSSPGAIAGAFGWATDVAPTILDLAGVGVHRQVTGKSLLPVLNDADAEIRQAGEYVGYELGGNRALFDGRWKLVYNRVPGQAERWSLFDINADPAETVDLSQQFPERFVSMQQAYARWAAANDVLDIPPGYDQVRVVLGKGLLTRTDLIVPLGIVTLILLMGVFLLCRFVWRRLRRN